MREEVCKLANNLAKKRGGHPADYMGEAWEIVQKRKGRSTKRVPIKKRKGSSTDRGDDGDEYDSYHTVNDRKRAYLGSRSHHHSRMGNARRRLGHGMVKGATRAGGSALRETKDAVNFTKAPKDSVNFSGLFKRSDPIPDIPEPIKKMFKIW